MVPLFEIVFVLVHLTYVIHFLLRVILRIYLRMSKGIFIGTTAPLSTSIEQRVR